KRRLQVVRLASHVRQLLRLAQQGKRGHPLRRVLYRQRRTGYQFQRVGRSGGPRNRLKVVGVANGRSRSLREDYRRTRKEQCIAKSHESSTSQEYIEAEIGPIYS